MTTTPPNESEVFMASPSPRRPWLRRAFWCAVLFVLGSGSAAAVVYYSLPPGEDVSPGSSVAPPDDVGIEQKLNAQVPADIQLHDEEGNTVRLGDLFEGKPIILTLVYYQCPMLCNMTRDGQIRGLTELNLSAGQDYTAITVSFDPRETPQMAAAAKRTALKRYSRPGAEQGWRFLTGDEAELRRLTEAVGFQYRYDEKRGQYAHGAGLIVLTPEGVVSRYLYGIDFSRRDLRLALVEASGGRVGSPSDQVLLLCYHYDPTTGKYGLAIMNLLRLGGIATVLGLATAIIVMIRREQQQPSTT